MQLHLKIYNAINGAHITDIEIDDELLNQQLDDKFQLTVKNGKQYLLVPIDLQAEKLFRIQRLQNCIKKFEAVTSDDPIGTLRLFSHYISNVDELLLTTRALFIPIEFYQINTTEDMDTVLNKADFEGLKIIKYPVFEQPVQTEPNLILEEPEHVHGPNCNH